MSNRPFLRVQSVRRGPPPAPPTLQLKGQTFGRLRVQDFLGRRNGGKSYWACVCECGKAVNVRVDKLTSGERTACQVQCGKPPKVKAPSVYSKHGGVRIEDIHRDPDVQARIQSQREARAAKATAVRAAVATGGAAAVMTGYRRYSREELRAAELLSARQMQAHKVPLYEIRDYLGMSREGGCTLQQARELLAA